MLPLSSTTTFEGLKYSSWSRSWVVLSMVLNPVLSVVLNLGTSMHFHPLVFDVFFHLNGYWSGWLKLFWIRYKVLGTYRKSQSPVGSKYQNTNLENVSTYNSPGCSLVRQPVQMREEIWLELEQGRKGILRVCCVSQIMDFPSVVFFF